MNPQSGKADTSRTRRRLLKGSASAPILSLMVSRPVLGAPHHCSPSGFASGNVSHHDDENEGCGGNSPGYWKNHFQWPGGYLPGVRAAECSHSSDEEDSSGSDSSGSSDGSSSGSSHDSFECEKVPLILKNGKGSGNNIPEEWIGVDQTRFYDAFGVVPEGDPEVTLMEVLRTMPGSLEFHAIAVLLNAAEGLYGDALSEQVVKDMYFQAKTMGYYETSDGNRIDDVQAFFEQTYH